jgi:hypothetical protein
VEENRQNQIPKVIHYFWLGKGPKPASVIKCIESWKRNCPDFEIKVWNEDNYDIHKHPYIERAYNEGKWAFVTDYARLDVLYNYGGIYFDTDVEVLKDFSDLCRYKAFIGFENQEYVNDGQGFGCVAGLPILLEMMTCYEGDSPYRIEDGFRDYYETPKLRTRVLLKHGLVQDGHRQSIDGIEVFPSDFFCPLDYDTGRMKITSNTHSIHHFDASWHGKYAAFYSKLRHTLNRTFGVESGKKIFGGIMRVKDAFKRMIGK